MWRQRLNRAGIIAVALFAGSFFGSNAQAQGAGFVGIEGQITDAATGRPVAGARAIFRQARRSDGVVVSDATIITDESGFYQFELQPFSDTFPSIVIWCQTPKGDTTVTLPLYATLRDQAVYVRNAAITLPKRYSRCVPF